MSATVPPLRNGHWPIPMTITLHKGDLPANLSFSDCVAVDTESMGLNWDRDRLCLVQLSAGDGDAHLVQLPFGDPAAPSLKKLMADAKIVKLFHFARADLAAIRRHLGVMPQPVYCTKVASILARTFTDRHSLKDLTRELIGVDLSKEQQTSDWGARILTQDQLAYAAADVLYLHRLKLRLDEILQRENRTALAQKAMDFLPIRAELDVAGWRDIDIFSHKPVRKID
jgi:ribonuclease D